MRLHEKGGKEHEAPCVPKLEGYLDAYITTAGIADDKDGPLFRTTGRFTGTPHRMTQQDGYRMIQRRARQAGIKTRIGNHSMGATGITDYLKSDGTLEYAQTMAAHSSPRTTPTGVIGTFLTLVYTIKNVRRQINAEILMKYTERYEHILDKLPQDALFGRFDSQALPPQSPQLTLCLLQCLNLCSEEYYLRKHGYLAKTVWAVWEGDLKRMIASPLLQREWPRLRTEYLSHPDFMEYVERIQAERKASRAATASR